jgi:putative hemolysin
MFELIVIFVLILLNGLFALSELAVVSSRKARLSIMIENEVPGAQKALALANDPNKFLSTVQIGITLIGVISGAYSGSAFGQSLSDFFNRTGLSKDAAESVGYGTIITIVTYLSVIIGELVPKQLALRHTERIACLVAPFMFMVSKVAGPLVALLEISTKFIFKLFGQSTEITQHVTQEEVKTIIDEAKSSGAINHEEHQMINSIMHLADRYVRSVMMPRNKIQWLPLSISPDELLQKAVATEHAFLPVAEKSISDAIGGIIVRDVLSAAALDQDLDIKRFIIDIPAVPEMANPVSVAEILRKNQLPAVFVVDEYGHLEGMVTPADILGEIVESYGRMDDDEIIKHEDGSLVLPGSLPAQEFADLFRVKVSDDYETLAGFILYESKTVPRLNDVFTFGDLTLEVIEMMGNRVEKVKIRTVD